MQVPTPTSSGDSVFGDPLVPGEHILTGYAIYKINTAKSLGLEAECEADCDNPAVFIVRGSDESYGVCTNHSVMLLGRQLMESEIVMVIGTYFSERFYTTNKALMDKIRAIEAFPVRTKITDNTVDVVSTMFVGSGSVTEKYKLGHTIEWKKHGYMRDVPRQGLLFDKAYLTITDGTKNSGKGTFEEIIAMKYLDAGGSVFDAFGAVVGEGLAWMRSKYKDYKRYLVLHDDAAEVYSKSKKVPIEEVKSSNPYLENVDFKPASRFMTSDFERYDIVISSRPMYLSDADEMEHLANLIHALENRRGYDKPVYMIIREASNLFFCYSDDTEVLTKSGWKLFKDVTYEDEVMTRAHDGSIEYQHPNDMQCFDYDGDMVQFGGGSRARYDMLVTPNHKMYVNASGTYFGGKRFSRRKVGFIEARDIKDWIDAHQTPHTSEQTPFELINRTSKIHILKGGVKTVQYNGKVYDLTVPKHHVIMVRRNGRAAWSSNSRLGTTWARKRFKGDAASIFRQMRHLGIGISLDSLRIKSIDVEFRETSDMLVLKRQGKDFLPQDLRWLYQYVDAAKLMRMGQGESYLLLPDGSFGYMKTDRVEWHKEPGEDLLDQFDLELRPIKTQELGRALGIPP